MKGRKQPYKKTSEMVANYRQAIKNPNIESEDTTNNMITNLEGSDTPSDFELEDIPVQKKSIWYKIQDWLRENWIGTIFIAAVLLLFQWGITAKEDIREIRTRIEYIDKAVENLDETYSRKDEIKIEIENIKKELNDGVYKNLDDLDKQIKNLENELDKQ